MRKRYNNPEIDYNRAIKILFKLDNEYSSIDQSTKITGIICPECGRVFSKTAAEFKKRIDSIPELCKACRTKITNIDKYGVENPFQSKEIQTRIKETNLKKYGVENPFQSKEIQTRIKETNLKKYGVENPFQAKEIQEKCKNTMLERYNVEHISQLESAKEKKKNTFMERYGVPFPLCLPEFQMKARQTCLEKYGYEYYSQSEECIEKMQNTCIERFGVPNISQSDYSHNKRKRRVEYNGMFFDSKPELDFYIHCLEEGKTVIKSPSPLEYEYEGAIHYYFPDFLVDGVLVEIKGKHFLNPETGKWYNPFDPQDSAKQEARYDCAIRNGVRIIYV